MPRRCPLPFEISSRDLEMKSSCNGLVLIALEEKKSGNRDLILWNPLTGDYKTLSKIECSNAKFELYYNSSKKDYKILLLTLRKDVCIYSLKSDSWRRVNSEDAFQRFPNTLPHLWSPSACWFENLYFKDYGNYLIRFDTKTEKFTQIEIPFQQYRRCSRLAVQRDCIHMCAQKDYDPHIELWKMNRIRDWEQVSTDAPVRDSEPFLDPLHLMRDGYWIMKSRSNCYWRTIYTVDLENKHNEDRPFPYNLKGFVEGELILIFCSKEKMSRDILTVSSTMRIPLLYRGEYSQWVERFMNYLEEQTDGEAMINSIKNEKRIQKIDRLARSLLIQRPPNDIYSLIDSNKTAKDLWDALARHMLGFEYGEQERKAAVLYEYETFKAIEGELFLDTYIRYLQVINDLKKYGYSKDNCELNFKFLNNLQLEWKQYETMMRQNKNLMDINIKALCNILKQNQGDVNDAMGSKEKVVVSSDSEGSEADDFSELKKITALLTKAFYRRKFYSKPTNNNLRTSSTSQSANKKQEFVKSDDKQVVKKADEKKRDVSIVKCYNCKKEEHFAKDCKKVKVKDYEYYKTKMSLAKKDKVNKFFWLKIKHGWNQAVIRTRR
nr:hypothetical protein [Tanacetum cinerariifolium]